MEIVRKRIRVSGRVQGVGFRAFVLRAAQGLGLAGWVRNLSDGSVLCEAQGASDGVARLLDTVRAGPDYAVVDGVDVEAVALEPEPRGFRIVR